ncbi:hypothetical protein TRIUR3_33565 [Triticum urartu]|uniref:Uncharacterized protein n=1 Tax=Triticum urartu TaxID=4572 RepID=M8A4M7_TRIUA|nr:hypothetical protein TRIUR3_33565 [Triticum urartu]
MGAQSGPVQAGSAAVLISGEVACDSRDNGGARPWEELISCGWGARGGQGPAPCRLFEGEEADGDDNFEAGRGVVSAFDGRCECRGLQRERRWLPPLQNNNKVIETRLKNIYSLIGQYLRTKNYGDGKCSLN